MISSVPTLGAQQLARVHRKRATCRACGGGRLHRFLSLGPTPLANAFLESPDDFAAELSFPLDVYFCETCSLVQLLDVIDAEVLFRHYIYVTGTSTTMAQHHERYAETVLGLLGAGQADLVAEVASNDGSLLRCFAARGVRTIGVEPAANIAALARGAGIDTVEEFFDVGVARRLRVSHGLASAVIGNNVLAHVDDTLDLLAGFREWLAEDGLAVFEVPYVGELVRRLEYDTVYHEHLCYFAMGPLLLLCERAGLAVQRIEFVAVHGGSIRVYARRAESAGAHAPAVLELVRAEQESGVTQRATYDELARRVVANRDSLVELLRELRRAGVSVAGYGAPAKGNTLLNYCGITTQLLPYTVDRNPLKVGRFTPGAHIPVLPVETLLERQPDYVLILAWNLADEIIAQQAEYQRRGGRFIIPVPEPRMV